MKRAFIAVVAALFAAPLLAVTNDCAALNQLGALYELRSFMMRGNNSSSDIERFVDRKVDDLREPLPDGGFRWVKWMRPSGDAEYDKHGHKVASVQGDGTDSFEASGDHDFAVRIAVPQKQSLFGANNAVWVGTVHVTYSVNGRTRTKDEAINAWMNPDTSRTIDLGAIAERVDVSLDAATHERDVRNALVEIHLMKAVFADDPANPNYEAIESLRRVRNAYDRDAIDDEIARVESRLFPDAEPMPVYTIVHDLRRADELMHSKKQEDQEKGDRILQETLRRLH